MQACATSVVGVALLAATGGAAAALASRARLASGLAVAGAVAGGLVGLVGAILGLADGAGSALAAAWHVPGGAIALGLDPLSAFFLAPCFALGALGAVYGRGYLGARPWPAAAWNGLVAAMAVVLLARHALVFLVAWETMTVLAYLLVTLEHDDASVRRAGWVYLLASHVSVASLIGLFLALGARAGGALGFDALAAAWQGAPAGAAGVLTLALVGFGIKAGAAGLHVWLPEAHAAAPSHVSALMSGLLVKLGVYGLLRTALLVAPGAAFGVALMVLGIAGAGLGIVLACTQRDVKRVLAYSTVENVGIVLLGLGLGFWARAQGDATLAALAFGGALLHAWNHAAMKSLLFWCAGSVVHATGTRDLERLGGLLRRLPWTGPAMIVGAVAIAGLPPLNGFPGEWLLYRALARVGVGAPAPAALAAVGGAAALAVVGGLAALCFVRLIGVVWLGQPRGSAADHAHEAPLAMRGPVVALAAACVGAALAAPALGAAAAPLLASLGVTGTGLPAAVAGTLAPVAWLNAALLVALVGVGLWVARAAAGAAATETWGCGYAAPTARMQYTGRGLVELASARLWPAPLRAPLAVRPPQGAWPDGASFVSDPSDPLTRRGYEPFLTRWGDRFARLRFLQQGRVHVYLVYILLTAIVGLAWVALREWLQP